MGHSTKRRRRDERLPHPPRMRLTERDKDILRAVAAYRVLEQAQLQALFFGSRSTAQYRLSNLFQHGYLARQFLPVQAGWGSTLYTLDRRGVDLLRTEDNYTGHIPGEIGYAFVTHTLAINDVRIAVTLACRERKYGVLLWKGEGDLKADYDRVDVRDEDGRIQSVSLIPDSFFVLSLPQGRAPFFLELDRGTETTKRFQSKILAYQAYIHGGAYTARYGYKSIRVLTTVPNGKRLESLRKLAEGAGGRDRFWFARLSDVTPQTILSEPIWDVAGYSQRRPLLD